MTVTELDPLIGREAELEHVIELTGRHRLVTLTGTGGSGKTRLARAAVNRANAGGGLASFVDLSVVASEGQIAPTVLSCLQLDALTDEPITVIASALAGRSALLMLDNLEHLAGASRIVSELLDSAPDLRVAATSRRPLGIRGEVEVPIAPLALPASDDAPSVESSPAGALFLARARAVGRLDQFDDTTAADVARLLRRLDGLPLAIELAAARTRIMTPSEILLRLETQGILAVDSTVDGPCRSLAGILDWTLGLLLPGERELMDALAICPGFDIALAEALLPGRDLTAPLEALVALGLVQPAGVVAGSSRFRLLETVRSEVLRRQDADAFECFRQRHADAMLERASRRESAPPEADSIAILDLDAENFRRALDNLAADNPLEGLRLWSLLGDFWETRGRTLEGLALLDRLAALAPDPTTQLSAALSLYVTLASEVRGTRAALEWNRRSLEVARAVGDQRSELHALILTALNARDTGDRASAAEVWAVLDSLDPRVVDPTERAFSAQARYFAAGALYGPLSDEALAALVVSTDLAVKSGRQDSAIVGYGNLALCRIRRHEPAEALPAAERGYAIAVAMDHRYRPWIELMVAMALAGTGEIQRAVVALESAIGGVLENGTSTQLVEALTAAIPVAVAAGHPLDAAAAWGGLLAVVEHQGVEFAIEDQHLAEHWLAVARSRARSIDIELAMRDGASTPPGVLLQGIAARLAEASNATGAASSQVATTPSPRHSDLTRREVEVLALVGRGWTDGQIADELFISPKTASVHVANIKGKLGLDSRLEVALRARELGLVADDR